MFISGYKHCGGHFFLSKYEYWERFLRRRLNSIIFFFQFVNFLQPENMQWRKKAYSSIPFLHTSIVWRFFSVYWMIFSSRWQKILATFPSNNKFFSFLPQIKVKYSDLLKILFLISTPSVKKSFNNQRKIKQDLLWPQVGDWRIYFFFFFA